MKKIYSMFMAMAVFALCLTSCSTDDPYITAMDTDVPRILQPDLPQGKDGKPVLYKSLKTNENLIMDIIVTPAEYTTVEWFDLGWSDEPFATGTSIDQSLMAGEHIIMIKATTTAGKSTSRTFGVNVFALPEDPSMADDSRSRYFIPGETKNIAVQNFDNVRHFYIGETEVVGFSVKDNMLSFNVPQMEEGEYRIFVTTEDGCKYACGMVTVSNEPYVDPGKVTLWSGEIQVDWVMPGELNDILAVLQKKAKVGSILRINVSETEADYHMCCAVVDWMGIVTCSGDPNRGDTNVTGDMEIEYVLNEGSINLISNGNEFGVIGFGCKLTKITLEEPQETVIYQGPSDKLAWSALEFKDEAYQALGIKPGMTITAYVTADEGAEGAIATTWWNKINTGNTWDSTGDDEQVKVSLSAGQNKMEYKVNTTEFLDAQGLAIVGNGFVVDKITVK